MMLVTGATGNVGRHVLDLLAAGGHAVRALSRSPRPGEWPAGVDGVVGDLADPASLDAALAGVESVFLFAVPGSGPAFAAAARRAGVRRVVLLSSGGVREEDEQGVREEDEQGVREEDEQGVREGDSGVREEDEGGAAETRPGPIAAYHAEIERALRGSGLEWTFLRPDVFAANTLMWAAQTRAGDVIRGAYADATSAPVHEADIAAVAVAALTEDGHAGRAYRLTGPQSLTHAEQAAILGRALGRPIRYAEVPAEAVRQAMSAHVPAPILEDILAAWAASAGRTAATTADIEKITGRPARGYHEWALDHAAEF